jgi:type II restriction enzyme
LKVKHSAFGETVTDGAYTAMLAAIREDRTPNLLLMRYALAIWEVRDLLLIPSFMFSESAVIKRKPLAATARRAGWIGCNFALNRIPGSARIPVVSEGAISPPAEVRERYRLARKQVEGLTVKQRGWRLDVLRVIQSLGKSEFSTSDIYLFEGELAELHPGNEHVKEKIRQQLQELRDRNLLLHIGRNCWRINSK